MILITGSSSGFGASMARMLAAKKKNLVLVARRADRLEALASELRAQHGIEIATFGLDIRDRAAVASWAAAQAGLLEKVSVLINNAGLARGLSAIQDGDLDHWDAMIDTNLKGLLYMTRAVLPFLLRAEGRDRHIVNIGSTAGHWMYPKGNVYSATKHAVHSLTEGIRMDVSGSGIRVTEISPGMAETEFSQVRLEDKSKARAVYQGMTPLSAEDVAEAVVWALERPAHVNIQEILLLPTDQASVTLIHRKEPQQ